MNLKEWAGEELGRRGLTEVWGMRKTLGNSQSLGEEYTKKRTYSSRKNRTADNHTRSGSNSERHGADMGASESRGP